MFCSSAFDSVVWSAIRAVQEPVECPEEVLSCIHSQEASHQECGFERPCKLLWSAREGSCTLIVQSAYKRGVNVPFCDLSLHFSSCKTAILGVF